VLLQITSQMKLPVYENDDAVFRSGDEAEVEDYLVANQSKKSIMRLDGGSLLSNTVFILYGEASFYPKFNIG